MSYQESLLSPTNQDGLIVTAASKSYLKQIASWSVYFAVLGFIGAGLMVLFALFMIFLGGSDFMSLERAYGSGVGLGIGIVYILLALIYIFPSYYLLQSSKGIKGGLNTNNSLELQKGIENLKSTFKFWGIFSIIVISIYIMIFLGAFAFGASSAL